MFPLEFLRMDQTLILPTILRNKTLRTVLTHCALFTVNSESDGPFGASQRLLSSRKKDDNAPSAHFPLGRRSERLCRRPVQTCIMEHAI